MVIKFNPEGRVIMVLGRRPEFNGGVPVTLGFNAPVPPAEPYVSTGPTDVAWDKDGNIFVSDGYGNSRVVKYDKNGRLSLQWAPKGPAGRTQSSSHHGGGRQRQHLCRRPEQRRIQVFDNDLKFKAIYDKVGSAVGRLHHHARPASISVQLEFVP